MKKILCFVFSLVIFSSVWSQQITKFSAEPDKFIEELTTFLKKANRPSTTNAAGDIESYWKSNDLDENQRKKIMTLCQKMLTAKMKPYPQYEDFVMSFYYAYNRESAERWVLDRLIKYFKVKREG